jgi:hypothetical protein
MLFLAVWRFSLRLAGAWLCVQTYLQMLLEFIQKDRAELIRRTLNV